MRQASVAGWTSIMAASVSAVVLALMLYRGLAEPEEGGTISLDLIGWVLLVVSLGCFAVSLVLIVYVRFLHSPRAEAPPPASPAGADAPVAEDGGADGTHPPSPVDLSGLPEDERRLYDLIDTAGGEILQMNLVSSGVFSKSKVTRLLDKLERRGLVRRERRGMTNLVKLEK